MIAASPAAPPPTGEALVTLASEVPVTRVLGRAATPLVAGSRTYVVRIPAADIAELRGRTGVVSVERNLRRTPTAVADPLRARQTYLPQIRWTRPRESRRPVVAVLDTGVDAAHPDLRGVVDTARARSFAGGSALMDRRGHGTHVAGIIAAVSGNTLGGSGVSNARILPIRVTDSSGTADTASLVRGIRYAIRSRVTVINISMGGRGYSDLERQAIQDAVRAGIVVVASSGNGGQGDNAPQYPGAYPHVIAVSAVTGSGAPLRQSTSGSQVTLAAPGWRILSTAPGGTYRVKSGTSMAAAIVSGTAVRVRANRPGLSPSQVATILTSSAIPRRGGQPDGRTGAGVVSVRGALATPTPPRDRPEPDDDPWTVRSAPLFLPEGTDRAVADAMLLPSVDDSDSYTASLRSGETLTVEVAAQDAEMDPDIWLWRPGAPRRLAAIRPDDLRAWRLAAAVSPGNTERLEVTVPATGVYTVEVRANASGGPYRMTAARSWGLPRW